MACAESTGELKEGHRNRWFIMFTDFQIDFGFVVAYLVAMILVLITGEEPGQLQTAWRVGLGLGAVFPLSLLWLRAKLKEPEEFNRETMKNVRTPYWLVFKFYGFRLAVVSLIWVSLYRFAFRHSLMGSKVHLRFQLLLLPHLLHDMDRCHPLTRSSSRSTSTTLEDIWLRCSGQSILSAWFSRRRFP